MPPSVMINTCATRTRHDWLCIARQNAFGVDTAQSIDLEMAWRVGLGPAVSFSGNKDIIRHVYDYYGDLNRRNPKKCLWAGLGRVAGGPFFWGFNFIDVYEAIAKAYVDTCTTPPQRWYDAFSQMNCDLGATGVELAIYEICDASIRALMQMSRDIFDDLTWQHEAYLAGGLTEILRLAAAGEYVSDRDRDQCVPAWTAIDQDDGDGAWKGNLALFEREQLTIISKGYAQLHSLLGVPQVMSFLANSPHPWGKSFYSFYSSPVLIPDWGGDPLQDEWTISLPNVCEEVTNNVARWGWMRDNIFPTWRAAGEGKRRRMIDLSLDDLCDHKWPKGL